MTITEHADILVIGAGPGGSLAAKTAAEKGLKTLFFERGRTPGDKSSSGCGLPPRCFDKFSFMKELDIPMYKIVYQELHLLDNDLRDRFNIRWSPSDLGETPAAREYFQINMYRPGLDRFLADLAVGAGAELRASTLVTDVIKDDAGKIIGVVTDKGEKFGGDVTIAADGAISKISVQAGLREKWNPRDITLTVDCDFEASDERIREVIGEDEFSNQVYVSPLYPATYIALMPGGFHVGFGQWLNRFSSPDDPKPYEYLQNVIRSKPIQKFIKKLDAKPREFHSHLLPWLSHVPENTFGDGIILVGDAAGFPCPLEAEGIDYAMNSGMFAAETAAEAIGNGNTSSSGLQGYETRWKASTIGEEFSAPKEWAELWAGVFFDPPQWEKLTQIANNIMYWASWSAPHIRTFKQELSFMGENVDFLLEFTKSYLMPLMKKAKVPMARTMFKLAWKWLRTKKRPSFFNDNGGLK
ncbi:MAG: NAD(P)/FAD-dependent oxidoreductase [Candidatus Hodarchaeota archaeon]